MTSKARLQYTHTTSTSLSRGTYRSLGPKAKLILPWMTDRKVLDLGCGAGVQRPDGIFYQIEAAAKQVTGVEIEPSMVAVLRDKGYDVQQGDVQAPVLRDVPAGEFDVVFGGEIIEHLDNFRGFLENVKYHLNPSGVLILTTVNAFAFTNWIRSLFNRKARVHPEHTCWFDEVTMSQLLERHGLEIVSLKYVHHQGHMQFWNPVRVPSWLVKLALPDRVSWADMVVVAKKSD